MSDSSPRPDFGLIPLVQFEQSILEPTVYLRWRNGVLEQLWTGLPGYATRTEWRPVPTDDERHAPPDAS